MLKLIAILSLVSITSTAAPSAQEFATGSEAERIYNALAAKERHLTNEPDGTLLKVVNFSSNNYGIQTGEKGMICHRFRSAKVIESMGTNYQCHLIDLTETK